MSWVSSKISRDTDKQKSKSNPFTKNNFHFECGIKLLDLSNIILTAQAKLVKEMVLRSQGLKAIINEKKPPLTCKATFVDGVVIVGTVAEIANIAIGMKLGFGRHSFIKEIHQGYVNATLDKD